MTVLVLGKSEEELADFTSRSPHAQDECTLVLVANPKKILGGYAAIANPFIDAATQDVVGVIHADTSFAPGSLRTLAETAASGVVTGIVGRSATGYVWGRDGGGVVSTLDSCSVFFQKRTGLRFDGDRFDDFHLLVEDLCLQARQLGILSVVASVDADHIGEINRPDNWMPNYSRYKLRLLEKWSHIEFFTT